MAAKFQTIDEYLRARNITQRQLATELGISGIFLSEIRRGKRTPRLALALRIARHCRIPLQSLVSRAA